MSINLNGFFEGSSKTDCQHMYDPTLSNYLVNFFANDSVVDLGCGMGDYVINFISNGITADGFDGNPHTPNLSNGICKVKDISIPFVFDELYDWVLSLEVGEHLPKEFEKVYINNLHLNNKKGIILSWAVKGQPGHGHVNCQDNDYIKEQFINLGYTNDILEETKMRHHSQLPHFKNTIMVFKKINC